MGLDIFWNEEKQEKPENVPYISVKIMLILQAIMLVFIAVMALIINFGLSNS